MMPDLMHQDVGDDARAYRPDPPRIQIGRDTARSCWEIAGAGVASDARGRGRERGQKIELALALHVVERVVSGNPRPE